ncbi:MAG: SPOR domain-containing protein [Steroidobacteraceae bacterium]
MLLLAACSPEAGDWRSAQSADTIEAYDAFIAKYPQSEFAAQATERTKQLGEERDWQTATTADTADAYQQFLSAYPEGKWAQEARVRIENFNVMQGDAPAPAPTQAATPPALPESPATAAVAPAPAPSAAPAPAASPAAAPASAAKPAAVSASGHRIQLGAFSTEAGALAQWRAASDRHSQLRGLSPAVSATSAGGARLYRLQAAVGSESEARALCDALKAAGQACLYVPPR